MKYIYTLALILIGCRFALANQAYHGSCTQNNVTLTVPGLSTLAQKVTGTFATATSNPCKVTVYLSGFVSVGISAISRSSNLVTATLSATVPSYAVGSSAVVTGVTDSSYNGTFTILSVLGSTQLTWSQSGSNSSSSGGSASLIAAIYSDNLNPPTAAANPFTCPTSASCDSTGNFIFYFPQGRLDVRTTFSGSLVPVVNPYTTADNTLFDPVTPQDVGTDYYANQYTSGSTTGGIEEAYLACQANTALNPTGCHVVFGADVTSTSSGTVTVIQNKPLYIDLRGHTLNFSCSSGVCLNFNAQIGGASEIASMEHGKILYTGSNGSSITSVMQVTGTDYTHLSDLVFGPPNGASPTAAANYLLLVNFDVAKLDTVAFLNNAGTAITLGTAGTGCSTPATVVTLDNVFISGFTGSTPTTVFTGCSADIWVEHSQWVNNTNPTLVSIDATGNISHLRFIDDQFPSDGDGTSGTSIFAINDPATYANSEMEVTGCNFFAGTPGANGTVYAFSGAGTNGNLTFTREKNLYVGPYANLDTGWQTGKSTLSSQEQFSGWTPNVPDDVAINGRQYGSGSVAASLFTGTGATTIVGGTGGAAVDVARLLFARQTTVSTPKFAFNNFGTTSALSVATNSKDQGGLITFTAGTISSNPNVVMTFQDGTWTNRPFCQAWFEDNTSNSAATAFMSGTNATQMQAEWPGSPSISPGDTVQLQWLCGSGG